MPTRNARARNMLLDFCRSSFAFLPPRIMKNSALARLPRMPMKARMTKYFMDGIIPIQVGRAFP